MQDFQLTIKLASPVVMKTSSTLDAILGGMLFADGMNGEQAGKCEVIDRWNDVPMASFAMFSSEGFVQRPLLKTKNFINRMPQSHVYFENMRHASMKANDGVNNSNALDFLKQKNYNVLDVDHVVFFGRGDTNAIEKLLVKHGHLGALRKSGYGEIETFTLDPVELEPGEVVGIYQVGRLLRPIPVDLIHSLPVETESYSVEEGRFQNPYTPALVALYGYETQIIARPLDNLLMLS
jgi:hypothetical protein